MVICIWPIRNTLHVIHPVLSGVLGTPP